MDNLSFFTAVTYIDPPESIVSSLLERVDDYFCHGGRKAYIIQGLTDSDGEQVVVADSSFSWLATVGKVLSYFTIVIPFFALIAKGVLRSMHSFKVIDPKLQLEQGVNVSEAIAAKIQELMPRILKGQTEDEEEDGEIEWLSTGNNFVFKLAEHPELVFKTAPPFIAGGSEQTNTRFKNMVKAKEVCLAHDLGLLIIPHAQKFTVNANNRDYVFIAEESLDLNPKESEQEELYYQFSTELSETVRQLAILIAKTGFNDVVWRNIPILNEGSEFQGPRRVALIDLEHMESIVAGFKGSRGFLGNGSCGLIGCVSEKLIDIVIDEIREQGVEISGDEVQRARDNRLQELRSDEALRTFYENNGIKTGKEPIQVDLDSLGLDLEEVGRAPIRGVPELDENGDDNPLTKMQAVTLRQVTEFVVAEMNRFIQNSSDQASIKGQRNVLLSFDNELLRSYQQLGRNGYLASNADAKQSWIYIIISALIDKRYIHKFLKEDGAGYHFQA